MNRIIYVMREKGHGATSVSNILNRMISFHQKKIKKNLIYLILKKCKKIN